MAPSRKSRSVNKRFSNIREAASSKVKDAAKTGKIRQKASPGIQKKRKLADMLGPQWSKEELEHFYEAYREHGKDWKKVALAVCNRTMEMVEALYTMNRKYLSLPEGTASVVGLIAMMTDHYSTLVMSVFKKTESKVERIDDAVNINNQFLVDDSIASATNFLPSDSTPLASQDNLTASTRNPLAGGHLEDAELNSSSDQNESSLRTDISLSSYTAHDSEVYGSTISSPLMLLRF